LASLAALTIEIRNLHHMKSTAHLFISLFALVHHEVAVAEKFMTHTRDKEVVTVFHETPCNLKIANTGQQPAQMATVFSRSTNKPVARGCWRFSDESLDILLKLENGQTRKYLALEIQHSERF
jgi:hypothetical protein